MSEDEYIDPEGEEEKKKPLTKEDLLPKEEWELPIPVGLRHATQALFYEYRHKSTSKIQAPYTLKNYDVNIGGRHYRSMYMEYMACDSEYEAAIKLLGSYAHWLRLTKTNWFAPYIEQWETERNIRDDALARSVIIRLTEAHNVTAAKSLQAVSQKGNKTAGRKVKGGTRKQADTNSELDEMLGHVNDRQ